MACGGGKWNHSYVIFLFTNMHMHVSELSDSHTMFRVKQNNEVYFLETFEFSGHICLNGDYDDIYLPLHFLICSFDIWNSIKGYHAHF